MSDGQVSHVIMTPASTHSCSGLLRVKHDRAIDQRTSGNKASKRTQGTLTQTSAGKEAPAS
jgi:hypothetical protein